MGSSSNTCEPDVDSLTFQRWAWRCSKSARQHLQSFNLGHANTQLFTPIITTIGIKTVVINQSCSLIILGSSGIEWIFVGPPHQIRMLKFIPSVIVFGGGVVIRSWERSLQEWIYSLEETLARSLFACEDTVKSQKSASQEESSY